MAATSQISYCDATINPWTGCTECSPGCDHCWAKKLLTTRLRHQFKGDPWKVTYHPKRFKQFEKKGTPKRIFVCSQSDFFHDSILFDVRASVYTEMLNNDIHTWLIVTKRPAEAAKFYKKMFYHISDPKAMDVNHIWYIFTICNQDETKKIEYIDGIPIKNKALSLEPLLAPVDISPYLNNKAYGIRWVIVGGESGTHARPMHPDWVRSIQKQCEAAGVAFYFKQWGKWKPVYHEKNTVNMKKVGTKAAGNLLDGKQYLEIPEN